MASLITELKRRGVLKVAVSYIAISWLLISIGDVFFPLINAPEWSIKVLLLTMAIGLPIVLVYSWAFKFTEVGIKRESDSKFAESVSPYSGKTINYITIGALAVALSVSVFMNISDSNSPQVAAVDQVGRQSIAVLPFSNRSTNPENALFVDGIHDDLLTNLAHISAFKVISRTSVMEYRDTTKNIRQIAEELGVSTVLEGAVQRSGDNVRINMQLIDAETDTHLWASSYDRKLTTRNIFEIQNEIAKQISSALKATLSPTEEQRLEAVPTENMAAYNQYRAARNNLEERQLETTLLARTQFEEAVRLDPEYSDAYSGLADSILLLHINHKAVSSDEAHTLAEKYLNTALSLDPENADAYASLGLLKLDIWQQTSSGPELEDSELAFEKALELNPSHARAMMWYASLKGAEHKLTDAIALYNRSLELDPLARIPYANLPGMYAGLGHNQEALDKWLEAARLHPNWPTPYQNISKHLSGLGRIDESIAWTIRATELDTDPLAGSLAMFLYITLGEPEKAFNFISGVPQDHPFAPIGPLLQHMINGNHRDVLKETERLITEGFELPQFVYDVASDAALVIDDVDLAMKYLLLRQPELASDVLSKLDPFNMHYVVTLAYIALRKGDHTYANKLLEAALVALKDRPRLGAAGHGIRDVQILALLNKPEEALAQLRVAIDAGFRSGRMNNSWSILEDPYLESIRTTPEFIVMYEEIQTDVARMRERAQEAEDTGDWDYLRSLASVVPVNPAATTSL